MHRIVGHENASMPEFTSESIPVGTSALASDVKVSVPYTGAFAPGSVTATAAIPVSCVKFDHDRTCGS